MYECDTCMGYRELSDTCSGIRQNTCTDETCEICPALNAHDGCENNCNFKWDGGDGRTFIFPSGWGIDYPNIQRNVKYI